MEEARKKEAEEEKEKMKEEAEELKRREISRLQSMVPAEPPADKKVC